MHDFRRLSLAYQMLHDGYTPAKVYLQRGQRGVQLGQHGEVAGVAALLECSVVSHTRLEKTIEC